MNNETLKTLQKSEGIQIKIRRMNYKGIIFYDLREFRLNKEGEYIATKYGFTLQEDLYKELVNKTTMDYDPEHDGLQVEAGY